MSLVFDPSFICRTICQRPCSVLASLKTNTCGFLVITIFIIAVTLQEIKLIIRQFYDCLSLGLILSEVKNLHVLINVL